MKKIITVTNAKGGTGKTTTAVNIAYSLSREGYKVLLIDTDPQGSVMLYLGISSTSPGLVESFRDTKLVDPVHAHGIDVVPANIELATVESELNALQGGETALKELIRPVTHKYDFIVIDTAPSLTMLSVNAITAADVVLIPVIPEFLSVAGLKGLETVIDRIGKRYRKALKYCILVTLYQPRRVIHRTVYELLKDTYKDKVIGYVRAAVSVVESSTAQKPVAMYDPKNVTAENYKTATAELINFIKEETK